MKNYFLETIDFFVEEFNKKYSNMGVKIKYDSLEGLYVLFIISINNILKAILPVEIMYFNPDNMKHLYSILISNIKKEFFKSICKLEKI